jgi:hypothetical protein
MKRLCLFLLLASGYLASCAEAPPAHDVPPDPALRDVNITYVHAPPDWIRQRGYALHLAKSAHDQTLAFSSLRRSNKTCVVTLPYPGTVSAALYEHLKRHEERHCHGEQHHDKTFQDEEPFDD